MPENTIEDGRAAAWEKFSSWPTRSLMMSELRLLSPSTYQLVKSAFEIGYTDGFTDGAQAGIDSFEKTLKAARDRDRGFPEPSGGGGGIGITEGKRK